MINEGGSPPHARGRLGVIWRRSANERITPACAGKTPPPSRHTIQSRITPACAGKTGIPPISAMSIRDHPRMRGEDTRNRQPFQTNFGSPPHARGRRFAVASHRDNKGITPACAGKTRRAPAAPGRTRDHPRMRGEDERRRLLADHEAGSPPHARGRLRPRNRPVAHTGITPACAGKTRPDHRRRNGLPDHPRMRGEDALYWRRNSDYYGSPPHARGRLVEEFSGGWCGGITPACAGKTSYWPTIPWANPDHPRMRGEDFDFPGDVDVAAGITPACAGKTAVTPSWSPKRPDHPRMRGEDSMTATALAEKTGSPPHARGRHCAQSVRKGGRGITPACAGKTSVVFSPILCITDHPRMRGEVR